MITEIAMLHVKKTQQAAFETAFKEAERIIASMQGYMKHELLKCMEEQDKYTLIVRWERLEDHTIGFRKSDEYAEWKKLLHHFYHPFPIVEHFESLN